MGKAYEIAGSKKIRKLKTTIRIPEDLFKRVQDIADSKGQTFNAMMNALLWESVGGRFTKV